MSNPPPTFRRTKRQAPCQKITLVKHNSLGSWDVFLSLFNSFVGLPPVDIVLLQDPPSRKGFLPSFTGYKSFCSPTPRPALAFYVSFSFLSFYAVLPAHSPSSSEVFHLDVYTPAGCFGTDSTKFRLTNVYSRSLPGSTKSVEPSSALPDVDFPCLVAGDFNIHNHAADPLRITTRAEEKASAPYFNRATDLAYYVLNTHGVYTRFPLSGTFRPSAIDLAFANPLLRPAFQSWDATTLPSTGSDHVLILIHLTAPTDASAPPRPMWDKADWECLEGPLKDFRIPPPPPSRSPYQLDTWFAHFLDSLVATVRLHTPTSRPSPKSKPWWTPSLTALRKEYAKACRLAKKYRTEDLVDLARLSQQGYFKAIKKAKNFHWSNFLARTTLHHIWIAKKYVTPRKTPRFPNLPEANSPGKINKAILNHFFAPKPELPTRGRLHRHASADPLTKEEITAAFAKSSPSSALGPDGVPYSVWKKVNSIKPTLLLDLLAPLVAFGYHPTSLKHANGVVLDKPGKPSYDTPASFRIIVLPKTVSKILERILTVRLTSLARKAGLLHPNQCGSLPGLSTSDAVATLTHAVNTLQRPLLKVSTLFLDIKAGFNNLNASKLRSLLLSKGIPSYIGDWVSSFLTGRECTLVFQGAPGVSAQFWVGTPQGSPISPLRFLTYVAPLHFHILTGVIVSYVDDFALIVASPSHRSNIRRLQGLFLIISRKAAELHVSFSVPKTELIHWRTHSERSPPSLSPITLDNQVFHPAGVVRWRGYCLSPAINTSHHFNHRLTLANASFSFVKRLSSPGGGTRPFLTHRVAMGLFLPILTYGADLLIPNSRTTQAMNSFWHRVCRWVTNNFYSTPTSILTREAYLPPIDAYCRHRRRLAALRIACAPPTHNPAAARLPPAFPSLSSYRALDSTRYLTKGLSSYYLRLNWRTPVPSPPMRKPLPIDAVAHLTIPLSEGLSRFPLVLKTPPPPGENIPPPLLMARTYKALKVHSQLLMLEEWNSLHPPRDYYGYPHRLEPHPFMGLDQFIAGGLHQMRAHKSYLAAHPSWWSEDPDTSCPRCRCDVETFEHAILFCPARKNHRNRYLEPTLSIHADSPRWDDKEQLHALSQYLSATRTGFPPEMAPAPLPSRSPSQVSPLSPA